MRVTFLFRDELVKIEYLIKNLPAVLCEMTDQTIYSFDLSFRRLLLVINAYMFPNSSFPKNMSHLYKKKKRKLNQLPPAEVIFPYFSKYSEARYWFRIRFFVYISSRSAEDCAVNIIRYRKKFPSSIFF